MLRRWVRTWCDWGLGRRGIGVLGFKSMGVYVLEKDFRRVFKGLWVML